MNNIIEIKDDEKKSLLILNERKSSLIELMIVVENKTIISEYYIFDNLKNQIYNDIEQVEIEINKWWNNVINKYININLENVDVCYYVDFNKNILYSD